MSATRICVLAAALLVCGWFALAIRQSIDSDAAGAIIDARAPLTAPRAAHARALLHAAAFLNPDRSVALLRATLALRLAQYARARAIAFGVIRREPESLQAWIVYGRASYGDRRAFLFALAHMAHLAPAVKPSS